MASLHRQMSLPQTNSSPMAADGASSNTISMPISDSLSRSGEYPAAVLHRAGSQKQASGMTSLANFGKRPTSQPVLAATSKPPQQPQTQPRAVVVNRSPSSIKDSLLRWCQAKTRGYDNVNITNFSSSWANGMAFCALIHHFLPHAFDYAKLDPLDRKDNFELAFHVAKEQADIEPLLEVGDMLMMGDRPDWKCVFCYVQSIYQRFRNEP